ncbi:CPBP family intramembrane glutamic endopeptidase [Lysobacter sp. CFH 32150]|uniref:CPBP family intramembrane glutamic endopeptidase n=1 Tax=Lysobacter sp. CFH 32150 TaxID=2927128 RepID=UPI001FA6B35B|nr:CPBP family intramembrane glutamic endopeptidase [Lysobacter sp. CFH 32150]MCI4568791.1 CPBP family intramembrane metalloprotease [Lysobacter sp. CFH 32150]
MANPTTSRPLSQRILDLWGRLPIALRAVLLGFTVLVLGQAPFGVLLYVNLKLSPALPWFLPATWLWLWMFWRFLDGRGWPRIGAERRRALLRSTPLSRSAWGWALLAGGLGLAAALVLALLTGLLAPLPDEAYAAPHDLSSLPSWTILACFLGLASVAGVVEEAAFRGYMLSLLQTRYGWVIGILVVAVLFYLVHRTHAYATWAFVPFFMAYSSVHGLLVYLTRSIRPSVLLHAVGDFCILPIQYGVIASPLGTSVGLHVVAVSFLAAVAAFAFRQLTAQAPPFHHHAE